MLPIKAGEGRGICQGIGPKATSMREMITEPRMQVIILGPSSQENKVVFGFYVFRENNAMYVSCVLIKSVLATLQTSENMNWEP
jgi:hypothetical protein